MGKVSELLQASLTASDVSQRFLSGSPRALEKGSGGRSGQEMSVFLWDLQAGNLRDDLSLGEGLTLWRHLHHLLFLGVEISPQMLLFVASSWESYWINLVGPHDLCHGQN